MPRHRDANPHGFVSHVACGGAHTLWIASTTEHPTPKTPNVTRLFGCGLNTSGQLGFTRTQAGATSPLARSPKASKSRSASTRRSSSRRRARTPKSSKRRSASRSTKKVGSRDYVVTCSSDLRFIV